MRVSGSGLARNGVLSLKEAQKLVNNAKNHSDLSELDEIHLYPAEAAINGFYDTILALLKGTVTLNEVRDFMFKDQDIGSMEYRGGLIEYTDKKEQENESPTL